MQRTGVHKSVLESFHQVNAAVPLPEKKALFREKLKVMMTKKATVGDAESWVNPTDDAK